MIPVAVFAYNRPAHLRRMLDTLVACDGFGNAAVTVFCDGPRGPEQADAVAATREVACAVLGSRADLRLRAENQGLARSVIAGVGELVERHGRVVVLEDDFELAPSFLAYMDAALRRYAAEPWVVQVSGHMFDVPAFAARDEALFLPLTTTWGWGTWARAWAKFDPAATGWQRLAVDRALRRRFNLDGVYDYATMLERQMAGKRDSWGIRWYWSTFQDGGLTLFPPRTLVRNTGQDGSGTHGGGKVRRFSSDSAAAWPPQPSLPAGDPVVRESDWTTTRHAIWRANGGVIGATVDALKRHAATFRLSKTAW